MSSPILVCCLSSPAYSPPVLSCSPRYIIHKCKQTLTPRYYPIRLSLPVYYILTSPILSIFWYLFYPLLSLSVSSILIFYSIPYIFVCPLLPCPVLQYPMYTLSTILSPYDLSRALMSSTRPVLLSPSAVASSAGDAVRCSVCDTKYMGRSCLTDPPAPQSCHPGLDACINIAKYSRFGMYLAKQLCSASINLIMGVASSLCPYIYWRHSIFIQLLLLIKFVTVL